MVDENEEMEPLRLLEDAPIFASSLSTSPLRAHTDQGEPILILGFTAEGDPIVTFPNGNMQRLPLGTMTSDWRFDEKRNEWVDINDAVAEAETPEQDGQSG